jgi:lysophospholipase L1-like esterase
MKLLVIGDSFAHGLELPDCPMFSYDTVFPPAPSKYSWPALLEASVTNLSIPGGSNSRIFRMVIDETIKNKYDLVICQWTEVSRLDLVKDNEDFPVTANSKWLHNNVPWIKEYYAEYYNEDQQYQTWLAQVVTLQNHFKYLNQQYLFVSMQGIPDINLKFNHLVNQIDSKYYLGWPTDGLTEWMGDCPKGPGGHPLELGHQRIAEHINEHIRNLGRLS